MRIEGDRAEAEIEGRRHRLEILPRADGTYVGIFESGRVLRFRVFPGKRGTRIRTRGREFTIGLFDPREEPGAAAASSGSSEVLSAMPGRVIEVKVRKGDAVKSGDVLLILEAMKMQNEIRAETDGTVESLECEAGQTVESGALLLRFEPSP
ncbi:MAG: acetyl-CoA carboxylase biotin carboxyl carrier protein subunit [Thermoanaerobaculia bacterium]